MELESSNREYSLSSILPIASGFYTDCRQLLEQFAKLESHTFSDFAALWREKCFSLVYCGRTNGMELVIFCSEVLKTAKRFLVPQESLITRLGALYLLYSLYFKQPTNGYNKIRLTVTEIKDIKALLPLLDKQGHQEGRYVFYKLLASNAFDFCATKTDYYHKIKRGPKLDTTDLIDGKQFDLEEDGDNSIQPTSTFLSVFDEGTLDQIKVLHDKYRELKAGISRPGNLEPSLDILENNFPSLLREELAKLRKKLQDMSTLSVQHSKGKATARSALVPPKGKKRGRKRRQPSGRDEEDISESSPSSSEEDMLSDTGASHTPRASNESSRTVHKKQTKNA